MCPFHIEAGTISAPPPPQIYTHSLCDETAHNILIVCRLSEEILLFSKYILPTPEEVGMRNDLIRRFTGLVHGRWPGARVDVFGSFATGLCLPTSDIDFSVTGCGAGDALGEMRRLLSGGAFSCGELEVIAKARIPLVKFRDGASRIAVDVSFGSANGPRNCRVVRALLQRYPRAVPLLAVIKYLLHANSLGEVYYGGLGSYALTLLAVSYFQLAATPGADAAADLVGFLRLYGQDFNYEEVGVSVRGDGAYFRKKQRGWFDPDRPYLPAVEDPDDTGLAASAAHTHAHTHTQKTTWERAPLTSS